MYLFCIFTFLSFAINTALGICHEIPSRRQPLHTVVYWGQNGGNTVEDNNLSTYCTPESGIDIIVLAFLYQYGNGMMIPSGTIGQSCYISPTGQSFQCEQLASAIDTCKANGVKVMLSLGGASGAYSLSSQEEAESIGQNLREAYGHANISRILRPFGDTFVNGWDFDIEFYNNPSYSITGVVNYVDWVPNVANISSTDAKVFTVSASLRYNAFEEVMKWSAGLLDTNVENGWTFAQEVKQVLTNLVRS
ncbi:chitinase 2 [Penicillium lagena]|uniref:chitinase 2 n=1 Tax=Penicillium lagena TaxID=94218 RepID=UPI00253FAE91|nr:chitinase 2 [Penicillium lagena]KAJ5626340.1 chitinase 2 [Penicillium lagena]